MKNDPTGTQHSAAHLDRITELEIRIAYLEEASEAQSRELAKLADEYRVAKDALQMMYKKMSSLEQSGVTGDDPANEPPPPHY